jgi:hypothetical protein
MHLQILFCVLYFGFCFGCLWRAFNWQIRDILNSNTDEILIIETAF